VTDPVPGHLGPGEPAVVLIISDGWETGDATELGQQMALAQPV
jgi:uncharacterized protein with von Willebrand factor type A (vWA) domain